MATAVPRSLSRALQRGSVPTTAIQAASPMSGTFSESEGPADGQAISIDAAPAARASSNDVFDAMFSGMDGAQGATDDIAAIMTLTEPTEAPAVQAEKRVAAVEMPPARTQAGTSSRAARFKAAGAAVAPAAAIDHHEEGLATAPVRTVGAKVEASSAESVRPWRKYIDKNQMSDSVSLRQGMAAAKVLTPIVAAVSFAPGSESSDAVKAKALTEMLVGLHRSARDTAETISTQIGKDVPSWMVTQLMQGLSTSIAHRWQRGEGADIDALSANMRKIFTADSDELVDLIRGAAEDAYVEVDHPDIARFRISVSAANAAWTIYDWVTHERLSLDDKGDMPSRFFTYGMPVHDLVTKILTRTVNECRGLVAQVESADLRTAHMQSSINRMANLVGSEYVTQTRRVMNWISDQSISEDEYQARYAKTCRDLETKLLPQVHEYARINFLRVEQGAFRAIEELFNEKNKLPEPADGSSPDRPAASR